MSTENVEVFNRYYGNGAATQFSIGFPYLKREFVKVYLYKKDTDEEKVLNSDQFSFVNDTTIQYPVLSTDEILKEGDIITIQRETELGSEFEFDNQRRLFPVEVMNADDLAFQQIQELSREIKRTVRVNPTAAETPEELLQTVYNKLDSATEIAGDAISAANQAQTAADNATAAVNSAEQTLANVTAYVDSAKVEIDNTKNTAISTINSTVTQAKADVNSAIDEATTNISDTSTSAINTINTAISTAESNISTIVSDAEGSITSIAVTEANKAIANAAQEATDTAKANVNSYVDGTVKPSLQTYVDQAQADANSAATSMEQAALSATAASNYASNASADADNAAESAGLAANSAAAAATSKTNAKTSETNAKIWAEGTDSEVQALGGEKSAKGWAEASTNLDYTNITNCITEIPQDIKLELNNGVLTLKAGSKVHVPNGKNTDGSLKFDEFVVSADKTLGTVGTYTGSSLLFVIAGGSAIVQAVEHMSGSTAPTTSSGMWYDTTNNKIFSYTNGTVGTVQYSLPVALIARTNGSWTSIDQIFNGFGYIGSTVYALPNVKGLIPNGRNADGSLRNIETNLTKVLTKTYASGNSLVGTLACGQTWVAIAGSYTYDVDVNYNKDVNGVSFGVNSGSATLTNGVITSFTPKTAFHAVDYNDYKNADDQNVKLTGNQIIAGEKTFNGILRLNSTDNAPYRIINKNITIDTVPSENKYSQFRIDDQNLDWVAFTGYAQRKDGNRYFSMDVRKPDKSSDVSIQVGYRANGDIFTYCPTPASTSNTTEIATTAWVKNLIAGDLKVSDIVLSSTGWGDGYCITFNNGLRIAGGRGLVPNVGNNVTVNFLKPFKFDPMVVGSKNEYGSFSESSGCVNTYSTTSVTLGLRWGGDNSGGARYVTFIAIGEAANV